MRFSWILLIIICLFTFFSGIGSYGLLDKDEPRYAGSALEMLESNNYIVPKFNFQNRFDKPVLFYWLIASSYKLFGVSDFTSRLPSAICATLCVFFTWYVAKIVFGRICGLICALVLLSSIEFVLLGRRAATDVTLCLFFSGSLYSLFLSYYLKDIKIKIFWTILAGVFVGLSILTKGPVGFLLPIIVLTLFLFFRKNVNLKHLKIYFLISVIAIFVALPWYLLVHFVTSGEFTKQFFFEHNFKRFTSVVGEHPGPIWFYIPVMLGGFMPWSLIFIGAVINLTKRLFSRHFNKLLLFSFSWIIAVFFFFSLSTTKLATYILLIFPPLSLVTGYWICILGRKNFSLLKSFYFSFLLFLIPSIYYAFFLIAKWNLNHVEKSQLLGKLLLCLLVMISSLILSLCMSKKYYPLTVYFTLGFLIPFVFGVNSYLVPYYKYTHGDLRDFAQLANKQSVKEIISFGMYRPSLVYYSRHPVDFQDKKSQRKKIKSFLSGNEKVFIIGHSSDIEKEKKIFEKMTIIDVRKKYFAGSIN